MDRVINEKLYLVFVWLLLFILPMQGQTVIKGKIIEKKTKEGIPYCHIGVPSKGIGFLSDERGHFELEITSKIIEDSIIISALGFETIKIYAKDFQSQVITLTKSIYSLPEIVVSDEKFTTNKLGARKKKNKASFRNCAKVNMQVAFYFPNNRKNLSFIGKVQFYITSQGVSHTPFRIRVYSVDTTSGKPSKNLLNQTVITKASKSNSWVTIDLSKYNISIPKNGFFIAMEWLYVEGRLNYLKGNSRDIQKMCFGQSLGMTKEFKENRTWTKIMGVDWQNNKRSSNPDKYLNAAITAEIIFKE